LVAISPVGTVSGKSLKVVATICRILKLKCTKFDFGWAPPQTSVGELNRPLDGFKGTYFKGEGGEGKGEGKGMKGLRGGEVEGRGST